MSGLTDAKFSALTSRLRRQEVSDNRPKIADLTPAVGGGIGGAAILAYLTQGDPSQWVRLSGIVCSALVLSVAAYCERGIRAQRNETEQIRIQAANEPNVIITNDPHGLGQQLSDED